MRLMMNSFKSLTKTILDYKASRENDKQFQMGVSYLLHDMK